MKRKRKLYIKIMEILLYVMCIYKVEKNFNLFLS